MYDMPGGGIVVKNKFSYINDEMQYYVAHNLLYIVPNLLHNKKDRSQRIGLWDLPEK